jgi:hypothetical protein
MSARYTSGSIASRLDATLRLPAATRKNIKTMAASVASGTVNGGV